jgi:serine/threonine protein kinase
MNENRIQLRPDSTVAIGGNTYRICGLLSGKGGSCLAYTAEREPSEYEKSIGMPIVPAVIKEFYPAEYAGSISRDAEGALAYSSRIKDIERSKTRFIDAAKQQVEFYKDGDEHSFAPTRIDEANNTAYTVVDETRGDTLDNARAALTRYEKTEILISLCEAIVQLHRANKLYLDIKPSNIWLLEKSEQSRRVALFDFDTVLPTDNNGYLLKPYPQSIPFSDSWSPREQQTPQQYGSVCRATDVYAFGAVVYWLYTDELVDINALNRIGYGDFTFLDESATFDGACNARTDVENLLRVTLRLAVKNRANNLECVLVDLKDLQSNSYTAAELPTIADKLDRIEYGIAGNRTICSDRTLTGSTSYTNAGVRPYYHNQHYNLFVLDDDDYKQGSFRIDKSRALTKEVDVKPEIIRHFGDVCDNAETAAEVKTLPSLFMQKNARHKQAEKGAEACYGVVDEVCDDGGSIKVFWKRIQAFRQQTLNECAEELGILTSTALNELDSSRWSIKEVDLIPRLEKVGISVEYWPTEEKREFTEGVLV